MADASKLKGLRRPGLGAPPSLEEARADLAPSLEAPEHSTQPARTVDPSAPAMTGRSAPVAAHQTGRIDGRTLRRSGRTVQFATRVSPEFDERVRRIAMRDGLLLVEVLERALDTYECVPKRSS